MPLWGIRHCEERSDEAIHLSVMPRYGLLRFARNDGETAPLLRRGIPPRSSDKAGWIAEALDHHGGQIFRLAGHAGAGAHGVAVLVLDVRRRFALLQRAGGLHHQLAEMHDAQIGGAEMLAGPVGDKALAVLHRSVLFGDALDAGIAFGLLQLAIDQIVV